TAKALTGLDDHSRFCVAARLMHRERTSKVCEGFGLALRKYGVPDQVLTDNGKVFTGRFAQPPVEVLFDRICRENGIEHLLTQPRSPTTTGKIERFHKTLRLELDTRQVFKDITSAQAAMDEWVAYYNTQRPHRSLDDVTPSSRFTAGDTPVREPEGNGDYWVSRKVTSNGIVCVGYQKVNVGQRNAGSACDILVKDGLLQFWVGRHLVKTEVRATTVSEEEKCRDEGCRYPSSPLRRGLELAGDDVGAIGEVAGVRDDEDGVELGAVVHEALVITQEEAARLGSRCHIERTGDQR